MRETTSNAASFAVKARSDIAMRARVFHDKFGYGEVVSQEGNKRSSRLGRSG